MPSKPSLFRVTKIVKRDGRIVDFDPSRIENAIRKAMLHVQKYDPKTLKKVVDYVLKVINEKFSEENIPHVEEVQDIVELALVKFDLYEVAKAYILYRKEREKIREEKKRLLGKDYVDDVDKSLSLNAIRLLASRYLLRDESGRLIEDPKKMFTRVAALIVIPDILYDSRVYDKSASQPVHEREDFNPEEWEGKVGLKGENGILAFTWNRYHLERMKSLYDELNSQGKMRVSWSKFWNMLLRGEFDNHYEDFKEYYNLMVEKKFLPNSPTLFNAGARLGQLSACFVLDIEDDINSIMDVAKEVAIIFKSGGGVGINYSKLRPEGDVVTSTSGIASGPVSFMRIIDTVTDVIKQGGCVSSDSYLRSSIGVIKPSQLPLQNPRDDVPLPISVYDGESYVDAYLGSQNGVSEVYRIETEYGNYVEVTYNEKIAVLEGDKTVFKEAWKLKVGDKVLVALGGHLGVDLRVEASNVKRDGLRVPESIDEDFSELLGYYMARGFWRGETLELTFNSKTVKDRVVELFRRVFNLEVDGEEDWRRLKVRSRSLRELFKTLEVYKTSTGLNGLPTMILQGKPEVLRGFLRGLFEGASKTTLEGWIVLRGACETSMLKLQQALLSLGVLSSVERECSRKSRYKLTIKGRVWVEKFLKEIGYISKRRVERLLSRLAFNGEVEEYKPIVPAKIVKVEKCKKETFHIETASGKYVVNGIIVHNKRRGANMGILEVWHPDIETFITCKSKEGQYTNFNISVMFTKDFWEYYEKGKLYPLINPRDKKVWKEIDPRALFHMVAENAWRSGDPGVLFLDNINRRNVLLKAKGPIRATNPCVSGDTRVLTPRGWKTVREVFEEAKKQGGMARAVLIDGGVLGEGGEPVAYAAEVVIPTVKLQAYKKSLSVLRGEAWVWHVGKKPGVKIVTREGYEVVVTPEHKLLTPKGWIEAKKLRSGDKVAIARLDPYCARELFREGESLDEDVAYALGWLTINGEVSGDYATWHFKLHDKAGVERVKRALEKLSDELKIELRIDGGELELKLSSTSEAYKRIRELTKTSSRKSREKRVPEVVWKLKTPALTAFIRGLFNAKTYTCSGDSVKLVSEDLTLLREVQVLLTSLGISSVIRDVQYKSESESAGKRGGRTYELVISGYSKQLYDKLVNLKPTREDCFNNLAGNEVGYAWATIEKVEDAGLTDFYDLTVPGVNAYVADGLIHHNCGEQPLYPYGSCNLGSINLYAFIKREDDRLVFDWEEYRRTIRIALRFLDNVIDVNVFPLKKIERETKDTRKVGLGLMGLADALYALGIQYNSEEGFKFMRELAENLSYYSMLESVERAKERGSFPLLKDSLYLEGEMPFEGYYKRDLWTLNWDWLVKQIKKYGIRNVETTSIAPTGSISMIFDVSSGIEPQFALVYEKRVTVGTFYYVDLEFERQLKERGLYSEELLKKVAENGGSIQELEGVPEDMKRVFVVAYDIPWWDHIRAQYEIQLWISSAVSKTINMPHWVTVDDVQKAYLYAYKLGLKGLTIYREGSKSAQVLVTPSQRKGAYVTTVENKTLELMKSLGVEPPTLKPREKVERETEKVIMPKGRGFRLEAKPKSRIPEKVENCPECGSKNLVYMEGCVSCLDCGWSACLVG